MIKLKYILITLFFPITTVMIAQSFTAQASKTKLAIGDSLEISYKLNARGTEFKEPYLDELTKYPIGPKGWGSSCWSSHGGTKYDSTGFVYEIKPYKKGVFKIDPASIKVKDEIIFSNSLIIEVVDKQ